MMVIKAAQQQEPAMAKRNEFVDYLCEQLAPMGSLSARAMFGGWSLYCDGLIFAIVVDEEPYFKADAETIPEFTALGLGPFTYEGKDGVPRSMAYYRLPGEALEDRLELLKWARAALGVALRSQAKKAAPRVKKPKS